MEMEEPVSVHDHEAFVAKNMPDWDQDVKDTKVYTWPVNNWRKLEKKITSPEFGCGGHKWRILLFPFGNTDAKAPNGTVSVYLDYANPKHSTEGWHASAQFALVISNMHDPTIYAVSHSVHRFAIEAPNWGFSRFGDLRRLFYVQDGQMRPTIEVSKAMCLKMMAIKGSYISFLITSFTDNLALKKPADDNRKLGGCEGRFTYLWQRHSVLSLHSTDRCHFTNQN
ncbi:hypothetical protein BD410DRAFT_793730 [Rickenella mellea]|uniref:MATH domain-containing protein n=1 Tax=Rickenella mellea TaxID=50990 RepID=A0A4Y7PRI2_9AGAM|nr:hypothetical protein BD410DRAFT_793730 [Rickenella mellea]